MRNLGSQCVRSGTPVEGLGEHRKEGRAEAWGWGMDSRCGNSGGRPGHQALVPCTTAVASAQGLCVIQVLWAMGGCDQPPGCPRSSVLWLLPSPKAPKSIMAPHLPGHRPLPASPPDPSWHPTSPATALFHPPPDPSWHPTPPTTALFHHPLQIHHGNPPPWPPPSSTLPCSCCSLSPLSSSNTLATKQAWPCHSHLTPTPGLPTTLRSKSQAPNTRISWAALGLLASAIFVLRWPWP